MTEEAHWWKNEGAGGGGVDLFDAAMGAYDGAEACELVGTFLICNEGDIGLYRVDGLAILRNKSGTQWEKIKKKL